MKRSDKTQNRTFELTNVRVIDKKKRVVEGAISTESPYLRAGGYEILSHSPDAIDLSWMRSNRAPVLADHNQNDQIGVVEGIELGEDRVLRAKMRFSKQSKGDDYYKDIVDSIRNNISVGYTVEEIADGEDIDGIPSYVATRWTPKEASIVALPADPEAYIGRSDDNSVENKDDSVNTDESNTSLTKSAPEANIMSKEVKATPVAEETRSAPEVDVKVIRAEAEASTVKRVSEIFQLGVRHDMNEAANQFVTEGKSVDQFRAYVLDNIDTRTAATKVQPASHIDLEKKDDAKYSLARALHAQLTGDWSNAGLEREVSQELATRMGRPAEGVYIPEQFLAERAMSVGGTNVGSDLVGTTHMANEYVSPLYNKSVLASLGARQMGGLVGDIDVPTGSSAAFYWLSTETTDITESTPGTGMINLSPKTVGGMVTSSHKLLRQSSPSVDALIRADLLAGAASAIDAAGISGTGANGQPTGILNVNGIGAVALGTNGAVPTYAAVRQLIKEIQIDNLEGTAFLGNPNTTYALTTTPKVGSTDSKMIMDDDNSLVGYRYEVTNNVPSNLTKGTGTDLSALILGDYSNLILATWGVIDVAVSASHGSNFASGQVTLRVMADVDVAVRRAEAFAAIVDMIT